jgi:hypothetical protein
MRIKYAMINDGSKKLQVKQPMILPKINTYATVNEIVNNKLDHSKINETNENELMKWNDSKGFLFYLILKKAFEEDKEANRQQRLLENISRREKTKKSIPFNVW